MNLFNIFKKKVESIESVSNSPELLVVKLFFENEPSLNDAEIEKSLKKRFKYINFPEPDHTNQNSRHYFFEDYEVVFKEGKIAAQGTLFRAANKDIDFEKLEPTFHQIWNWPEAESIVRNCKHEIILTDLMTKELDYPLRLECFQKFIASIVEALDPSAIWISNGQKLLSKEDYLSSCANDAYQNLNTFINVRLFNIQNSNNQMIMDTIGLHSLGLPDFEIKFSDFNPSIIAELLFNYGNYIYENGVVIENGNTIQGIEENQKWKCYFKDSTIEPKRIVIKIEDN